MLTIRPLDNHPAVMFAAQELARCLKAMTGERTEARPRASYDPALEGLWVGAAGDVPGVEVPAVADPALDDAVRVRVQGRRGALAGSNPRSALLAIYRYLTHLGARWVRPGPDGEYLPRIAPDALNADIAEAASCRHRGVCIEGAVSEEHVRAMVDWLPRVGMNAYFTQFREAYTFFDRWYAHTGSPMSAPKPFSVEQAREIMARVVEDVTRRGLLYHAVGHGWTCEPFGMAGLGWDDAPVEAPPGVEKYLALVNGKRQVWGGIPLNTNLCYSNPEARRIVVEEIARYAEDHPEVDLLHVWLADGVNNNCECEACAQARPSDFYVRMLNEVDARLTARGIATRIVFLIYVDLLWPPERERLANPARFVLMFAPITRSYSRVFSAGEDMPPLPPFERNKLTFPRSVPENVAFLRAWQAQFAGDSFDFDYHYMWDHYFDPADMQIARVAHGDAQRLADIGLGGFMSCQTQRAFFPTGLGITALARALWDRSADFDAVADDHFRAAFGADGPSVRTYLEALSGLFDPVWLRGEKPGADSEAAERLAAIPARIAAFLPVLERNAGAKDPCRAASWRLLAHHADLCEALAGALEARARGDRAEAWRRWEATTRMAWAREEALHPALDVWLYQQTLNRLFPAE